LINFVDATNDANHYTKPPPGVRSGHGLIERRDFVSSNRPMCTSQNRLLLKDVY